MVNIIFSDVDGTLLNSEHHASPRTKEAIAALKERGIPFVIVSARSPSGIATIVDEIGIDGGFGPIVAYSGGLIISERGKVLFSRGMEKSLVGEILDFIDKNGFKPAWCLYSYDQWLVRDKADPRVIREENIVKVQSTEGGMDKLDGDVVHKIMCISSEAEETERLELEIKKNFPQCAVVRSCATQLEIMLHGVNKGEAVRELCAELSLPIESSAAFGDNYNDVEMLESAGTGFIMANAPEELKTRGFKEAASNDDDGVFLKLKEMGLI